MVAEDADGAGKDGGLSSVFVVSGELENHRLLPHLGSAQPTACSPLPLVWLVLSGTTGFDFVVYPGNLAVRA